MSRSGDMLGTGLPNRGNPFCPFWVPVPPRREIACGLGRVSYHGVGLETTIPLPLVVYRSGRTSFRDVGARGYVFGTTRGQLLDSLYPTVRPTTSVENGHPRRVPATRCGLPGWNLGARKLRGRFLGLKKEMRGLSPQLLGRLGSSWIVESEFVPLGTDLCPGCDVHTLRPWSDEACANRVQVSARRTHAVVKRGCLPPSQVTNSVSRVDSDSYPVVGVNSYQVPAGSAGELLEQVLTRNPDSAYRRGADCLDKQRLRRRAVWVNRLAGLLGLTDRSLGLYLRGRCALGLTTKLDQGVDRIVHLFEGGAKYLGAGTARIRPLTKDEEKEGVEVTATPFMLVWDGNQRVGFLPELVARLSIRSCFRARDDTLVPSLKLKALEWCKTRYLTDVDTALFVPFSVALACSQSLPERAAVRALEGDVVDGKVSGESKWGVWGARFGGWGSTLVSGIPRGPWWKKGVA